MYTHFEDNGISVGLVFRLRQLRERIVRVRLLLDCPAVAQARPGGRPADVFAGAGGPGAAQSARTVRLQLLAGRGQGGRAQR